MRRVAVAGDGSVAGRLAAAGVEVVDEDAAAVDAAEMDDTAAGTDEVDDAAPGTAAAADADVVFTVGESALFDAVLGGVDRPVVPVGVGEGHHAITRQDIEAAAEALASGAYRVVEHPILGVDVGGERVGRAVMDVTLMTAEPARISEFAVHVGGEALDSVRADGIVAATPLGSSGYARAAGGSVLAPGAGLVVVPVAPFATRSDTWVADGAVRLTVERGKNAVSLFLDDELERGVGRADAIDVAADGRFEAVRFPGVGER